ncbi:MAG: phosphoglycerate dehydrogenase [Culicoidibacterales bacterium]
MFNIKTYNAIAAAGLEKFADGNYDVDGLGSPDAIVIRSQNMHQTDIPQSVLAIGRAGAGVNNVPIEACADRGIVVFNTPGANANAVKELVLANLFMAARPILEGAIWTKSLPTDHPDVEKLVESEKKRFVGTELVNKKLGIIGLGAIGAMVANDAYRLGMDVIGFDPYVSVDTAWNISSRVKRVHDIDQLLSTCDYITIHIPLMEQTKYLLDAAKLAFIKEGAVLLNFSRGELVDNDAVLASFENGGLSRYITDFAAPALIGHDQVVILPHLGASTNEAEVNCAKMAARTLKYFLETGNIKRSVNFPTVDMSFQSPLRFALIHRNIPNMVGTITLELASNHINIVNMINRSRGDYAYTLIDIDVLEEGALAGLTQKLEAIADIKRVRVIRNTNHYL